jgi:hypothetical protein
MICDLITKTKEAGGSLHRPPFKKNNAELLKVETVQIHHLGPCSYEILYEFLL